MLRRIQKLTSAFLIVMMICSMLLFLFLFFQIINHDSKGEHKGDDI